MANQIVAGYEIQSFAEQVARAMNPQQTEDRKAVEKGYILYSQGMVRSSKRFGAKILAVVQDVVPCQVNLNLKSPLLSMCSCPGNGLCRHILAVFFHYYSLHYSVSQWLNQWKGEGEQVSDKQEQTNAPSDKKNWYHHWVAVTDSILENELDGAIELFPFLISFRLQNVLYELEKMEPTKKNEVNEYLLVTNLHLLNKLMHIFVESPYSFQEFEDTCRSAMATIFHNIEEAIDLLPRSISFTTEPFATSIRKEFQEVLFWEGPFRRDVLLVYWDFWSKVMHHNEELLQDELRLAEEMARKSNPNSLWSLAYSFLLALSNRMEEATTVLERAGLSNFQYVFFWLEYFAALGYYEKFGALIPFFLKHVENFMNLIPFMEARNYFDSVKNDLRSYCQRTNQPDLYETILFKMLTHSTRKLIHFYHEIGVYRRMVDFIMVTDQPVTVLTPEQLETIQKEDPESLLPLYHQEVDRNIAEKNRENYKQAVYYLQQIKAIYHSLQQGEIWRIYFEKLLHIHQRLRAFKEECRKGKLIDG